MEAKPESSVPVVEQISRLLRGMAYQPGDGRLLPGAEFIRQVFDFRCDVQKETDQRETYDCVESRDISVSDTCIPRCKYCYATSNFDKALNNYQEHDKEVPSLISSIEKEHFHSDGFRCSGK